MQILLAIDSFKGCLSSEEVEAAFSQALTARGADVRSLPMSDGGEGMLPAFITALHGQLLETEVHDPLMRPVTASYGLTPDGTAVIETAQACGLTRLSAEERNPLVATTYGVGELVAHAFQQGARRFIIGLGGSGTSDAGKGMLQGLTNSLAPGGMTEDILNGPLAGCSFVLASDVRNPLYGYFRPAKGSSPGNGRRTRPPCPPVCRRICPPHGQGYFFPPRCRSSRRTGICIPSIPSGHHTIRSRPSA